MAHPQHTLPWEPAASLGSHASHTRPLRIHRNLSTLSLSNAHHCLGGSPVAVPIVANLVPLVVQWLSPLAAVAKVAGSNPGGLTVQQC